VRHLGVFSDGLQMQALKMPEALAHAQFFNPLFRFTAQTADPAAREQKLAAFLSSSRIRERTDDDATLVVCARMEPWVAAARRPSTWFPAAIRLGAPPRRFGFLTFDKRQAASARTAGLDLLNLPQGA
jgi:hypothetical protein